MLTALAALLLAGSTAAATEAAAAYQQLPNATFQWGRQYDVVSKSSGRTYRIYVHLPEGPAPASGWPVVFAPDGYLAFPTLAAQMVLRQGTGHGIVVAIGYPEEGKSATERFRDLTFSTDPSITAPPGAEMGGGEAFYHFIVDELRPQINARFGGDPANSAYLGYSLGGLFGLHILFAHPGAFRTFVIGSPSIWWRDRAVLALEPGFAKAVRAGTAAPRVLITADAWEQGDRNPDLPPAGPTRDFAIQQIARARMVDNARELYERLAAIPGKPPYEVQYRLFPETGHNDGVPLSAHAGLRFIFAR